MRRSFARGRVYDGTRGVYGIQARKRACLSGTSGWVGDKAWCDERLAPGDGGLK